MNKHEKIKKIQNALIALFVALDIALIALNWIQDREAAESRYIGTIPFANQNIEWTGAGYQFHGGAQE